MTRATQSRVKYLRLALREAYLAGDTEAVKRITARVMALQYGIKAKEQVA